MNCHFVLIMKRLINIYFAGSIRGGREDVALYHRLIGFLKQFGNVMTEHIGDGSITSSGDTLLTDVNIHDRDMRWLESADLVVAEVTTPSLGVGYELGRAVALGIKVITLFRELPGKRLSAMIAGSPGITSVLYREPEEAERALVDFIVTNFPDNLNSMCFQ